MKYIKVERPFDLVAVDLYGPLPKGRGGVVYIFVVLDTFTKFVRLYIQCKDCLLYTSLNNNKSIDFVSLVPETCQ